jgi:hypothetical protein
MMEILCRHCPNKCKDAGDKKRVMKYCSEAPENNQILEDIRRKENAKRKSKKAKANKTIPTESREVVWNASDWLEKCNQQKGA